MFIFQPVFSDFIIPIEKNDLEKSNPDILNNNVTKPFFS